MYLSNIQRQMQHCSEQSRITQYHFPGMGQVMCWNE